jgi:hypothetical protein
VRRRVPFLIALLAALAALAGCGGGKSPAVTREHLSDVAIDFQRQWNTKQCDPIVQRLPRLYRFKAVRNGVATTDECFTEAREIGAFSSLNVRGTREFGGQAGVMDATTRVGHAVLLWALDSDRRFKLVAIVQGRPQIGTAPNPAFDAVASELVRALRAHDCGTVIRLTVPGPYPVGFGRTRREVCHTAFGKPRATGLWGGLQADPAAAPQRLAATQDFAFYRLDVRGRGRWTIVMTASALPAAGRDPIAALDVLPAAG